ncbi:MAG TPA: leucyl aminopeptidase [Hyphomicrobiales bacterium]|nr:leucyl aminopeptidase [Hyphomicrobiales bacterium]
MADEPKIAFAKPAVPTAGTLVVLADEDLAFGAAARDVVAPLGIERAAATARFKGKAGSSFEMINPVGAGYDRLIVFGLGKSDKIGETDWVKTGGQILGKIGHAEEATILFDPPDVAASAEAAAALALGMRLRAYRFDRYKTRKKDDEDDKAPQRLTIGVEADAEARRLWRTGKAIADGVDFARDLVNEPANVLVPVEFARRAEEALEDVGVTVEVLDQAALKKIGMRALLGVNQGSANECRVVVMRWDGAKEAGAAPIAFIGKGVCFDTGGISIKPAGGMEDMKGDMAGAACVVGLMHALAARKAKVNAVGLIGVVENMPDGNAQRPGDIVTSLSGQTIEVINTDAEGRLVLSDVLWYCQERFKPQAMIDLATLTGAILVALGQEHAGLFSNDDTLAERLAAAGRTTGERVWRMPLGPEYDKLIDSKFADMKNVGGRNAGSITAAQFLKRFVNDVPWAHLDIAGTGMAAPQTDTNRSWGSGWGVRLLDRLVAEYYEG